jgi:hypothetical protein
MADKYYVRYFNMREERDEDNPDFPRFLYGWQHHTPLYYIAPSLYVSAPVQHDITPTTEMWDIWGTDYVAAATYYADSTDQFDPSGRSAPYLYKHHYSDWFDSGWSVGNDNSWYPSSDFADELAGFMYTNRGVGRLHIPYGNGGYSADSHAIINIFYKYYVK